MLTPGLYHALILVFILASFQFGYQKLLEISLKNQLWEEMLQAELTWRSIGN